jgi:soluble lytic murein transglycosylase
VVDWDAIEIWLQGRIGGGPLTRQPTPACELMTVGLREAAAAEIRAADRVATPWGSFALLREAAGCGLTDVAAGLAVSLRVDAGVGSGEPPKDLLRLSYPVDFAATLSEEARKADVDPLFLASLVRQESFWDPQAGSTAGALGLTQVIPQTGAAIAEQLGVADFRAEDLFLPALSLEFGAYYLGGELRSYRSPLLALAAYNAGPGPAGRWASAGDTNPADVVERIDYVETKAYVTYIYEAYAHYLVAWGD